MILSTHALVGAALATLLPADPALVCAAGISSHFVIDAILHWDYPLRGISLRKDVGAPFRLNGAFIRDCLLISLDACVGMMLAVLFFDPTSLVVLGALAGMLPDPLQFVHRLYPHEPLKTLQRFHGWIHSGRQLHWPIGVVSQLAFAIFVVVAANCVHS